MRRKLQEVLLGTPASGIPGLAVFDLLCVVYLKMVKKLRSKEAIRVVFSGITANSICSHDKFLS